MMTIEKDDNCSFAGTNSDSEQKPMVSTSASLSAKPNVMRRVVKKIHINNDDNYATPPEVYNLLNEMYDFDFDPCPYNEGELLFDGLKVEWGKSNFVNPPYSQKLKEQFIRKGIEEMNKGKVCVFLIPVSTSTILFHTYIKPNASKIEFVKGRIKFGKIDGDGNFYLPLNSKGKTQSGTKDSMIVVFDGRSLPCA